MLRWLARRVVTGVMIVAAVATAVFFLIRLAPGDPFTRFVESPRFTPELRQHYRQRFGLDQPLWTQYTRWVSRLARGDFGHSIGRGRPVAGVIADALPHTLLLAAAALTIDFLLGISLGTLQAARHGGALDRASTAATLFLYAAPVFWFGLVLQLVFSEWLAWLPASGAYDVAMYDAMGFWGRAGDRLRHLVLPALTLGLVGAAGTARFQRSAVLEALAEDFVRTARAKGLPERRVVFHHALRNALLPVITLFGIALPFVLGGAVLVENVFAWPGLGHVSVEAVVARDYDLVAATVILAGLLVALGSGLADGLYRWADPRTRGTGR